MGVGAMTDDEFRDLVAIVFAMVGDLRKSQALTTWQSDELWNRLSKLKRGNDDETTCISDD